MEIWKLALFAICLSFWTCKSEGQQANQNKDDQNQKMSFGYTVHSVFKKNGKYYLSKCSSCFNYDYYNKDESSIIELTLNKVIQSCQDEHGRVSYKIDLLCVENQQFTFS